MNITGNRHYSKSAVGLRQPSTILNQHQKLVFLYPMLCTNHLSKYKDTIREFFAINTLKEIFISNTLNLVSLSSQIDSPQDENRVNVSQTIGNVSLSLNPSGGMVLQQIPMNQQDKNELQYKINEKIERIKKYLNSDMQLKPLMPHIDFITLENLIDVPVIVGTKAFDADTLATLLVLTTAIGTGRALNSKQRFNQVMIALEKLTTSKGTDVQTLLNNLVQNPTRLERVQEWLQSHPQLRNYIAKIQNLRVTQAIRGGISRVRSILPQRQRSDQVALTDPESSGIFDPESSFQILRFNKPQFDQIKIFFKFMLDENAFYSQTGVRPDSGQMSGLITAMNPNFRQVAHTMHTQFMNLLATVATPVLRSISNIIYPDPSSPSFDFLRIKDTNIDTKLNNSMLKVINDHIIKRLTDELSGLSPQDANKEIKLIKNICANLSQTDDILEKNFKGLLDDNHYKYSGLDTQNYDVQKFERFLGDFEKLTSTLNSFNKSFLMTYSRIVRDAQQSLSRARQEIYSSIDSFFSEYENEYSKKAKPVVCAILGIDVDDVTRKFIPQVKEGIFSIIYFFLLYRLQSSICQLMDVLEYDVETAEKDVLEWPNYIMVIPVEFMQFLHTVIVAKTWQNLTNRQIGTPREPAITDNYIKGIVNFVSKRLNIPNLVVIDEKKQDVYYKFMYMGAINKTKISNIETFIKQNN